MSLRVALGVFARAPIPGQVKTRLVPALGAQGAANLYAQLLERMLDVARAAPVDSRVLWVDTATSLPWFASTAGFELAVQANADLGTRMAGACASMLAAHAAALVVGSDLADVTAADIALAVHWLSTDADVVLGPVADGGYWLLGVRGTCPPLFDGIDWSTPAVYAQTVARLAALGADWRALPLRHDVDEQEDLGGLRAVQAHLLPRRG